MPLRVADAYDVFRLISRCLTTAPTVTGVSLRLQATRSDAPTGRRGSHDELMMRCRSRYVVVTSSTRSASAPLGCRAATLSRSSTDST